LQRAVTVGFFSVLGMIVFITFLSPSVYSLDAFEIELAVEIFDRGYTQVFVPPLGTISARTHLSPLQFSVTLRNVDPELLVEMAAQGVGQEAFVEGIRQRLLRIIERFVLRVLGLAALGGAFGVLFLGYRRGRVILMGAVVGFLVMALLLGVSYLSYDTGAFLHPEYRGILRAAPWMIGLLEEGILKVRELGEQIQVTARNLATLFARIDNLPPLGSVRGDLKVLVVSDIHNNPAALDFIQGVVDTFAVDLAIDAGDFTDWGTPLEAVLTGRLKELGIPYLFVPGNHESPQVVEALGAIENVTILDGQIVRVKGVSVLGVADPSSHRELPRVGSAQEFEEVAQGLRQTLKANPEPQEPLFLVVHNPILANRFLGEALIIVHGHTHKIAIRNEKGSIVINPGTSGAAGIRGLQVRQEVPYSVVLVHLEKSVEEDGRTVRLVPLAVDSIQISNVKSGLILERILVEEGTNLLRQE